MFRGPGALAFPVEQAFNTDRAKLQGLEVDTPVEFVVLGLSGQIMFLVTMS